MQTMPPYNNSQHKKYSGFTLIELSIVLVIIGLIAGGVLVGRDLIGAAKLRAVISEQEKIKTAINVFRLKYNCLAGDCKNASDFFSGAADGNGNKSIQQLAVSGRLEMCSFWDHLRESNILARPIHKEPDGTGLNCVPYSDWKKEDVVVVVGYRGGVFGRTGQSIHIGQLRGDGWNAQGGGFEILEAKTIDEKVDDGIANTGKMYGVSRTYTSGATNCSTYYYSATGQDYRAVTSGSRCHLVFWLGF